MGCGKLVIAADEVKEGAGGVPEWRSQARELALGTGQTVEIRPLAKFLNPSTGFLEHLKLPTDGPLSTKCLPSPRQ